MTQSFSKTQIDRLGERLKGERYSDDDLRSLSLYCDSFAEAYEEVVNAIQSQLLLEPSGREAKSHAAIIAKLKRESIRLTQIQDIAGCRLVVPNLAAQDEVVNSLLGLFEKANLVDRRERPSFGYRAVHVIARVQDKLVEIQVRTALQHIWAEYAEAYFDYEPEIKYGGGSPSRQMLLSDLSEVIKAGEAIEKRLLSEDQTTGVTEELSRLYADYAVLFNESIQVIKRIHAFKDSLKNRS